MFLTDIDWLTLFRDNPKARVAVLIRTNLIKTAISGMVA